MKKLIIPFILFFAIYSCSDETNNLSNDGIDQPEDVTVLSNEEIDDLIYDALRTTGEIFNWADASDQMLYSAIVGSEGVITIGYGEYDEDYLVSSASNSIKQSIIENVNITEGKDISTNDFFVEDEEFNILDLTIENFETVQMLRQMEGIRYIEPGNYAFDMTRFEDIQPTTDESNMNTMNSSSSGSGFGCSTSGATIDTRDYRTIAPNTKYPWAFDYHNIEQAWQISTGDNIEIAVIDTGVSQDQPLLTPRGFSDGFSANRRMSRRGTYRPNGRSDGFVDRCGHGTQMIAAAAAPRNDDNLPVGVAYDCDVISYRGTADVLLNTWREHRGVQRALNWSSSRSSTKIVSISLGNIYSIGRVRDGVRRAHSRGKLVFAAGGTSPFAWFLGVTFPGNMSETVAVTGVNERGRRARNCHDGRQIDFTFTMERNNGNTVPILGYDAGESDYVGGSSVATAATAGIAALVWAEKPSWTRDQVIDKMKRAGKYYPNENRNLGYGNVDALKAVQ